MLESQCFDRLWTPVRRARRLPKRGKFRCMAAGTDINNIESLQRGARNFMNYCSGCHSLKYLRYNRMATDLKIPGSGSCANLIFTSQPSRSRKSRPRCRRIPRTGSASSRPILSLMARERGTRLYLFLPARLLRGQDTAMGGEQSVPARHGHAGRAILPPGPAKAGLQERKRRARQRQNGSGRASSNDPKAFHEAGGV